MTVMEDKIMNTILGDKELLDYIERLVAKRLPPGPHLKADYAWYKQVVDLTINQAFEDLQVVETLNHQISQLGKYLKKKSQRDSMVARDGRNHPSHVRTSTERDEEESFNFADRSADRSLDRSVDRSVEHPSFSSSEPIQRSRRKKESPEKFSSIGDEGRVDRGGRLPKKISNKPAPQRQKQERDIGIIGNIGNIGKVKDQHAMIQEEGGDIFASNPKLQYALDLAKMSVYHSSSSRDRDNRDSRGRDSRDRDSRDQIEEYGNVDRNNKDEILRPSSSYSSELNNIRHNDANGSHSLDNDFALHVSINHNGSNGNEKDMLRSTTPRSIPRYSNVQTSLVTDSNESYGRSTDDLDDEIKGKTYSRRNYTENENENENEEVVYLSPAEESDGQVLGTVPYEPSLTGSQADTVTASEYPTDSSTDEREDEGNGGDKDGRVGRGSEADGGRIRAASDLEMLGSEEDERDEENRRREREVGRRGSRENEGQISPNEVEEAEGDGYDDSDFDETDDNDEFDQNDQNEKLKNKLNNINNNSNMNNGSKKSTEENGIYASWSMPSDNVCRVHFSSNIVSNVFNIREKYSLDEIPVLFYTHDESIQFTSDYNRESLKAEAVGLTWIEWWEERTEEDVARDDKEQELMYREAYDDDSIDINDDLSDDTDDFRF